MTLMSTFVNFFILSFAVMNYLMYLFMTDRKKFNETMIRIGHFSIKTYSYAQIYSQKAKTIYVNYVHPQLIIAFHFLLKKIRETELYNKYVEFFKNQEEKGELEDGESNEGEDNEGQSNECDDEKEDEDKPDCEKVNNIEFIKNGIVLEQTTKSDLLEGQQNTPSSFDFILYENSRSKNICYKIFYELPTQNENFDTEEVEYNVQSFSVLHKNNEYDPISIQLVNDDYSFWLLGNKIGPDFMFYFLNKYYVFPFSRESIEDYQLQIITKDYDVLHMSLTGEEFLTITKEGIQVIKE